jgi:translation initiation factor 3 subunit A
MDGFSASPQAILLSMISFDPMVSNKPPATAAAASTSASTSQILLPSLKFLWEIYRAILDILRSNSKLEHVYHITAQSALKFCQTYHRKMEFRHLCDMLRTHLGNLRHTITTSNALDTNEDGTKSNNKVKKYYQPMLFFLFFNY